MNRWALRGLAFLVFVAVFGGFIANDKPLYCKIEGKTSFPVLKAYGIQLGLAEASADYFNQDWAEVDYEKVVFPLIPYASTTIDRNNMQLTAPNGPQNIRSKRWRHWLGTDEIGRDIAAGLIAGTRVALLVGIIAMSIATLLGLFFGLVAGFYGDDGLQWYRIQVILLLLALPFALFYAFLIPSNPNNNGGEFGLLLSQMLLFLGILSAVGFMGNLLGRLPFLNKKWTMPMDTLIMRLVEIINSLPGLLLILAVLAVVEKPSVYYIMIVIGLISWTSVTRYIRAELLRIRQLDYMQAARALGFSDIRLLLRHALPNGLRPVLITISFGMASAILLEAFLSFLGIGLPAETVTWGSMIRKIQGNVSTGAWWIAVFPGLAIFFTVTLFNLIGEGLTEALDPKQMEE
jgi:peptide/nickel transport system permease protein